MAIGRPTEVGEVGSTNSLQGEGRKMDHTPPCGKCFATPLREVGEVGSTNSLHGEGRSRITHLHVETVSPASLQGDGRRWIARLPTVSWAKLDRPAPCMEMGVTGRRVKLYRPTPYSELGEVGSPT